MPNCFQLTRKGDTEPSYLQHIDCVLCQALDLPWSPTTWTYGWYDDIGFALAMGKTLSEVIDINRAYVDRKPNPYREHNIAMWRIAAYLNEHYTAIAWSERK